MNRYKNINDKLVREFIHNRHVMNVFHFIRKGGNKAVHGDEEESPEEAIDVLKVHFVTGETACMLGLIENYPAFEEHVAFFAEARYGKYSTVSRSPPGTGRRIAFRLPEQAY